MKGEASLSLTLITRHYPPAVSGGARRPFLLAQELRNIGVEVYVVAPTLPTGEPGAAAQHPHRDAPEQAPAHSSWRDATRDLLLWPDPDIRWSLRAANAALALPPSKWVLTTSPPKSVHAAGAFLKRRIGARWIADFRDHWLTRPHRAQRHQWWRRAGEAQLAKAWLKQADLVLAVDSEIAAELAAFGAKRPYVLPHVATPAPAPAALPAYTTNIVHTGSLSLSDPECNIELMLTPFAEAHARNPALRLHLAGRLTDYERAHVASSSASEAIVEHGVIPMEDARALQAGADALIFAASSKMHVPPSKIVEYLTTAAPIIACGMGPWRNDPRTPTSDPVEAMASLSKGARVSGRAKPPSPAEAAQSLLALMLAQTP